MYDFIYINDYINVINVMKYDNIIVKICHTYLMKKNYE
jgi:hypothetical protein